MRRINSARYGMRRLKIINTFYLRRTRMRFTWGEINYYLSSLCTFWSTCLREVAKRYMLPLSICLEFPHHQHQVIIISSLCLHHVIINNIMQSSASSSSTAHHTFIIIMIIIMIMSSSCHRHVLAVSSSCHRHQYHQHYDGMMILTCRWWWWNDTTILCVSS